MKTKWIWLVLLFVVLAGMFYTMSDQGRRDSYNAYMSGYWMSAYFSHTSDIPESELVYVQHDLDETGVFLVFGEDPDDYAVPMPVSDLSHMAVLGTYEKDVHFICQDDLPKEKCQVIWSDINCYREKNVEGSMAYITCAP